MSGLLFVVVTNTIRVTIPILIEALNIKKKKKFQSQD